MSRFIAQGHLLVNRKKRQLEPFPGRRPRRLFPIPIPPEADRHFGPGGGCGGAGQAAEVHLNLERWGGRAVRGGRVWRQVPVQSHRRDWTQQVEYSKRNVKSGSSG